MMEILQSLKQTKSSPDEPRSSAKKPPEISMDLDYTLLKAEDPEFLLRNIDWLVLSDKDPNKAICVVCSDQNQISKGPARPGVFSCDQEFKKLKYTVKEHANLESHLLKLNKQNLANEKTLNRYKRNEEIGFRLGSLCYQILQEGESLRSYPKKVALLASNGVDCGQTNHSRRFVTSLIKPFKEEISMKFKTRPIAISRVRSAK